MTAMPISCHTAAAGVATLGAALLLSMAPKVCLAQASAQPVASTRISEAELIERLSESQLKGLVLRCAHQSSVRVLLHGEAAFCSVAWESLKKRSFAGDSDALLAWWQTHRDDVRDEAGAARVARQE